jgi:hypothetical protein
MGEIYLYLLDSVQDPGLCKVPPLSVCNPVYGDSIGRGAYKFPTGQWSTLSQTITLNTPKQNNGKVSVSFNGQQVISFDKVGWIQSPSVTFLGIDFETFFGGKLF